MVFNLPEDVDTLFYIQLLIFFVIGFLINVHSNGIATLVFFENEYGQDSGYVPLDCSNVSDTEQYNMSFHFYKDVCGIEATERERLIKEYPREIVINNARVKFVVQLLYFFIYPLSYYVYGYWAWRNGILKLPKSIYTSNSIENHG